jgi:predicted nucleic acid-binding protein
LIKLIVIEPGSGVAAELWNDQPAVSSILAYPEGRAALAAARRGRRLTPRAHAQALAEFEALNDEMALVGIDADLAHRAGDLADKLKLRGHDAVHLASALALGDASTVVVTWDGELSRAAAAAGLAVAPGL